MTAKRICRVCGKEYEACHTLAPLAGTFRWQEVACSPECGAAYLKAVMIARGEIQEEPDGNASVRKPKTRRMKSDA